MARHIVIFKNSKTNKWESLKVGFNFFLLFFGFSFFGLFLYLRGLYIWGIVATILNLILFGLAYGGLADTEAVRGLILLIMIGLSIYIAVKGNELTAKWLINKGYEFVEPESEVVIETKRKWKIE